MINIPLKQDAIIAFCLSHQITKLSLFGSVLTTDFRKDSDIDVLVEFAYGNIPHLFKFMEMQEELTNVLGREVDLHTPKSLSRHFRQKVLESAYVIYE